MNGLVGRAQTELHRHGDLAALYEELAKLHHPACPDVDWRKVEQWCRELLRDNGSDLQIAALQCDGAHGHPRLVVHAVAAAVAGLDIGKRDASLVRTLEADLACLQDVLGRQRMPAMTALRALNQQVSALAARLQDDASPPPGPSRERGSVAPDGPMRLFISMPEHGGVAPVVYLERRPGNRMLRGALVLLLGLVRWCRLGSTGSACIATEPVRLDSSRQVLKQLAG